MRGPAEVSAEDDLGVDLGEPHVERGGAEDVSRPAPGDVDAGDHRTDHAERHGLEQLQGLGGVVGGVQRFSRVVLGVPHPVGVVGLLLLEVAAVGQDHPSQAARALGAVDGASKAEPLQPWQVAAVIDVGVRQHDRIDRLGRHRERVPVRLPELLAALEQSAVDQQAGVWSVDQGLAPGHRLCSTDEAQHRDPTRRHGDTSDSCDSCDS